MATTMEQQNERSWELDEELAIGSGQATLASRLGMIAAENPDKVVAKKGLRVFEDMERKDAHYASILQTRKLALLGKGYEIQPASDDPRDVEIAEFVRWNFEHMRGSLLQDLLEVLDAMGKGFSLMEKVFTLADRGPFPGKVILKALKAKDQNYFGFALDEFDNVLEDGIVQNPMVSHGLRLSSAVDERTIQTLESSSAEGFNRRLPRDKFVHFAFNARAENPYGRGLGSVCYWYSWFKTEAGFKFWLVFLEKFGSPTGKVTVTKEASDTDKAKVRQVLRALQQETGVILPEGLDLEFLEAKRNGSAGYEDLIKACNAEQSKAVLGQTLTTEQGDRGARSLGEVHQEVRFDILRFDADQLESVINEQVICQLVDFNYLDVDAYPMFKVPLKQRKDLHAISQSLESFVRMGARIPERYIHDELGIPVAEEDEPVLRVVEKSPQSPVEPFAERKLSKGRLAPPARLQRQREAQDELIEAGAARGRTVVEQLINRLIDQVRRGRYIEERQYNGELSLNIAPLRQALISTAVLANLTARQLAVEELEDKGVVFARERFESFAEEQGSLFPELVGPDEAIELFKDRIPISKRQFNRLVADARRKYFTIAGIEEAQLLKIVQEALIEAIETGGTVETFALAVRESAVKYTGLAFGQDLAGQALKDSHIRLIFRNNIMSAYNEGRRATFDDPDVADFIPYLMYLAIDDDRARPAHAAMDGRIYRKDDPIWARWYPPNGHNCRCTVVPVTTEETGSLSADQIVTGPAVVNGRAAEPDKGFGGIV